MPSVSITIPLPTNTFYDQVPKAIGAGIKAFFEGIVTYFKPERTVRDAGNGEYTLIRRGEAGHVRLKLADPGVAAPRPVLANVGDARVLAPPGAALASADAEAEAGAPTRVQQLATAAANVQTGRAAIANAHGSKAVEAEAKFGSIQAKEERRILSAFDTLLGPPGEGGAARQFTKQERDDLHGLVGGLLAIRQPRAAEALDVANRLDPQGRGWALATECGVPVVRLANSLVGGEIKDDTAMEMLDAHLEVTLDRLDADIATLHVRGLLRPELLRGLAEIEGVRKWNDVPSHATVAGRVDADALLALATTAELLHGMVMGSTGTIDFVLAGDRRNDSLALAIKQAFPPLVETGGKTDEGLPTTALEPADTVKARHDLSRAKRDLAEVWRQSEQVADWSKTFRPVEPSNTDWMTARTVQGRVVNVGGSDALRIDARLLGALRKAAEGGPATMAGGADAGRQVNLLVANVMLMQSALDRATKAGTVAARQEELDAARQAVGAMLLADPLQEADPLPDGLRRTLFARVPSGARDTPAAVGAALLGDGTNRVELGRLTEAIRAVRDFENAPRESDMLRDYADALPNADATQAAQITVYRARADKIDASIPGLTAKLDLQLIGLTRLFGTAPTVENVLAAKPLANAIVGHNEAVRDLAVAKSDQRLGLDDTDLRRMGFADHDIADLKKDLAVQFGATVKQIAEQGLTSADDVKKVNDAINANVQRLFGKGMAQSTMREVSRSFPEGRARLFLETVQRGTADTPVRRDADGTAGAAAAFGAASATRVAAWAEEPGALDTMSQAAKDYADAQAAIGEKATRVASLARGAADAQDLLTARASKAPAQTVDPTDSSTRANATQVIEVDRQLKAVKLVETEIAELTTRVSDLDQDILALKPMPASDDDAEPVQDGNTNERRLLDKDYKEAVKDLEALRKTHATQVKALERAATGLPLIDGNTLATPFFSRITFPNWAALQSALPDLLVMAEAVRTIRDLPKQREATLKQVETLTQTMDAALAARRNVMAGSGADAALRNAIRAAVVETALAWPDGVTEFDPMHHRATIEAKLRGWTIDPARYGPELTEALQHSFDADIVGGWLKEAQSGFDADQFRIRDKPGVLTRAGEAVGRFITDDRVADWATQRALMDSVTEMRLGDSLFVAQGDKGSLDTTRIPVEASGTLKVRLTATMAERKAIEVRRTTAGYEVFFKAGVKGDASAGVFADAMKIVSVGVTATAGGARLSGAAQVYDSAEDVNRLLETLFSRREVTPKDWAHASETTVLTERSVKLAADVQALATTDALMQYIPTSQPSGHLLLGGSVAGAKFNFMGGVQAQLGVGKEWQWAERGNASKRVIESQTSWEVSGSLKIGVWATLPTIQDTLVDHFVGPTGIWDKADAALGTVTPFKSLDPDPRTTGQAAGHMIDPFVPVAKAIATVDFSAKRVVTTATRLAYEGDGLLSAKGNTITRKIMIDTRKPEGSRDLAVLAPNVPHAADQPDALMTAMARTLATDEGKKAYQRLMESAAEGDTLAVTYALRDDVRETVNDALAMAARDRRDAEAAALGGRVEDAKRLDNSVAARERFARSEYENEANYEVDTLKVVKSSASARNLTLASLGVLTWSRSAEGGTSRPALTLAVPGGPTSRAMALQAGTLQVGMLQAGTLQAAALSGPLPLPLPDGETVSRVQPDDLPASVPVVDHGIDDVASDVPMTAEIIMAELQTDLDDLEFAAQNVRSLLMLSSNNTKRLAALDQHFPSREKLAQSLRLDAFGIELQARLEGASLIGCMLKDEAIRRLSGEAAGRVSGDKFHVERQVSSACAVHALNAFFGGPALTTRELDDWVTCTRELSADDLRDYFQNDQGNFEAYAAEQSSDAGVEPGFVKKILEKLEHNAGSDPLPVGLQYSAVPDGKSRIDVVTLPTFKFDRIIMEVKMQRGVSGPDSDHYVAFRKDDTDAWWLLDSRSVNVWQSTPNEPGDPMRRQVTPQVWLNEVGAKTQLKAVVVIAHGIEDGQRMVTV